MLLSNRCEQTKDSGLARKSKDLDQLENREKMSANIVQKDWEDRELTEIVQLNILQVRWSPILISLAVTVQ